MKFSFVVGLALRHGARTFELVRELTDDEYIFEDVETRRPRTLRKHRVLEDIESGKYVVLIPALTDKANANELKTYQTAAIPEKVQEQIDRRYSYVIEMRKAGITRGNRTLLPEVISRVARRLEDDTPPSVSTVLGWAKRYEDSGNNARALASGNFNRKSPKRADPLMEELIRRKIRTEYLTRDRRSLEHTRNSIVSEARQLVAEGKIEPALANISAATIGRWVSELDQYHVIKSRYGRARARLVCRTPMGNEYPEYPFEQIEVDHTPLDWIVICDRTGIPLGRPLLTASICAATGYPAGLYLSFYGPNLTSVSGVLRNTIAIKDDICKNAGTSALWLASGVPDTLILDNGLEFHANAFRRMAQDIGMDLTYSRVRTPWSKPHIERFFGDLGTLTLSSGRTRKRIANVVDIDPRTTATITFSNLVKGLVRYMVDVYPVRVNDRKLARPYDLMLEGISKCPPASYVPNLDSIRLATAISKPLTVNQGGVELHGIPYGTAELAAMRKSVGKSFKTLIKWDPDNMDQIFVQHPITSEWVSSPSRWPHYTAGLSWNQHLLIRKFLLQRLKEKDTDYNYIKASMALHEFWMDVTSPKCAANAKLAAQFSGVTSARVLSPSQDTHPIQNLLQLSDTANGPNPPAEREIPNFDSFRMD